MALELKTAQQILLENVQALAAERVPLTDAWQRVLAAAVVADRDFPPFDRSPLDGYALVAAEVTGASPDTAVSLNVIENIPAGKWPQKAIGPGSAARIMTGAPVPAGATGIVRLEDTRTEDGRVMIFAGRNAAANICRKGEEMTGGETILKPGTVIGFGTMGLLALLGEARPLVFRRPKVAVIATGSEVRGVEAPPEAGTIRNSNSYMLAGQIVAAGAEARLQGIVRDDTAELADALLKAPDCDLLVSTGGVSAGDYDLMAQAFHQAGIRILFDRVAIKPGMPVLAGIKDGRLYLGLSGNPAAAAVAFELLVRPVLLKQGGRSTWWRRRALACLAASFAKSSGAPRFVWVYCQAENGRLIAEPLALQGNGMLRSAVAANALAIIPAHSPALPAGAEVEVLLIDGI